MSCGGGTQIKTRTKAVEEKYEGLCEGESITRIDCNEQKCPGKNDLWNHTAVILS